MLSKSSSTFEEKAKAINDSIDEIDEKRSSNDQPKRTTKLFTPNIKPQVPTNNKLTEDMAFWLQYRQEIDYSKPTPFACPPMVPKNKPKSNIKKRDEPLIEEVNEEKTTKLFCVKRKRNEEPLDTFYIPTMQQTKKTKIADLQRQFAATNIENEPPSIAPSVSLFKFTLLKTSSTVEKSTTLEKDRTSASIKQQSAVDSKTKTTERAKSQQEALKKKRLLRINEKRREGDKQVVEFSFVNQVEKNSADFDLTKYASMLDSTYGKDTATELQKQQEEYELDYYTVETTTEAMNDDNNGDDSTQPNVLKFETFDDQLLLENMLEGDLFGQEEEYDSEDSNASNNPNNEYPEEEESESDEDDYYYGKQNYLQDDFDYDEDYSDDDDDAYY